MLHLAGYQDYVLTTTGIFMRVMEEIALYEKLQVQLKSLHFAKATSFPLIYSLNSIQQTLSSM